jgi:hypothetical protein
MTSISILIHLGSSSETISKKGKNMAKCKEFSVNLAVLAPSNKRQFSFGMMRGCVDDKTPFYVMVFILRDLINNEFQDRVKVKVTVGPTFNDQAEALMKRGLTAEQLSFLQGPLTSRAGKIPPSGGKEVEDKKMTQLGQQMLNA